jgi:hypothetical protein
MGDPSLDLLRAGYIRFSRIGLGALISKSTEPSSQATHHDVDDRDAVQADHLAKCVSIADAR